MELHPVTLLIGAISTLLLIVLVSTGLSCTVYVMDRDGYEHLQWLYDIAKFKRIC